jgi:hypothetical protein
MSSLCQGLCETNRECIAFVPSRQVRYKQHMRACVKCGKAWITEQRLCHCCKSKMRYKRRVKKNHE